MQRYIAVVVVGVALWSHGVQAAYQPDLVAQLPDFPALPSTTYAGYIPISNNRLSFYLFQESQGNPAKDPLVLWLNGGPGCSSLEGAFSELGSVTIAANGSFVVNPYAWTKIANVLYLESPPGVGFSIDTPGHPNTYTDNMTAQSNYESLTTWLFTKFPEYVGRDLYLTGESYAGHYIPQLAYEVYLGNATVKNMMRGFMVGNPCTGDIGCANDDPTLNPYLQMHGFLPINTSVPSPGNPNYDPYDILVDTCPSSALARYVRFPHPVVDAYKRRKAAALKVGNVPNIAPCSDTIMQNYLNRADVQSALHTQPTTWNFCGGPAYDMNPSGVTHLYQIFMDNTNWNILVYSGNADTVVNFAQTETILFQMGRAVKSNWNAWNYNSAQDGSQLGGFYVWFDRMSFATVNGAGHMVPQYQPAPALELFTSYLTTGRPGRM